MTNKNNFAIKYRPKRFEDVRGQEHPVAFLSEAIKQGRRGYDLLIHGQVGSGKTSLVRLYEMALNCEQPTEAGSPCLDCDTCKTTDRSRVGLKEYDVSGRGDKDFDAWLDGHYQRPTEYRWQVLFLDEAHSLSKEASDSLLKRIEDRLQENVIICLATTEFDRVRPNLRSRIMKLEVRPLKSSESIRLLRDVAELEGIAFEPDGLALLAGIAGNQPRDLLNALEEVAVTKQTLTEAYVREFLDVDHKPGLLGYLRALADGDLSAEIEALENWRETRANQARWISAFLLSLYYNNIQRTRLIVEPITHSIQAERAEILQQFQDRFGVSEVADLAPYWRGMLRFWAGGIFDDEVAAQLQLTVFRSLVVETPQQLLGQQLESQVVDERRHPRSHQYVAQGKWEDTAEFLSPAGACTIIDLASLLIQEYGVGFNAAFEVRIANKSMNEADLRQEVKSFLGRLNADYSGTTSDAFAYLALLEREGGDPRALIVAHLPKRRDESAEDWSERVREMANSQTPQGFGIKVDLSKKSGVHASKIDWSFHWDQTLNLCLGVADESGDFPFAKLRMPETKRRNPGPVSGGLLLRSERLSDEKVNELTSEGLAPFKPASDGAWEFVRAKWELKEHDARKQLRRERDEKLANLKAAYEDDKEGWSRGRENADRNWRASVDNRATPWTRGR